MITLYSLDKKGKIRVFKGEVSLSGELLPNTAYIHTYTGLLGGNLTKKTKTINDGKQNRSVNEQAQFELDSLVFEKVDEGYKSKEQLAIRAEELHYAFPSDLSISDLFERLEIKFNTNKYWLPLPMLAEKWKEKKAKVKYPRLVQPKLNGVRCIAVLHEGIVKLLSRGGQVYRMPHIEAALLPFLISNPTLQLDGELYNHGMPLQQISGIVRLEDEAQFDRKLPIQYWIYDLAIPNVTQDIREELRIDKYYPFFKESEVVRFLWTETAKSEADVDRLHNEFVADDHEGAIVRDPEAYYQFGFRDACLLKVKEFIDEEFEIVGSEVDPNKGIESFVFILKNNINELTFKARPTGTLEEKDIWRQNMPKYIGKKATIRYQERTQDGLPSQGHVRHKDSTILMEHIREKGE